MAFLAFSRAKFNIDSRGSCIMSAVLFNPHNVSRFARRILNYLDASLILIRLFRLISSTIRIVVLASIRIWARRAKSALRGGPALGFKMVHSSASIAFLAICWAFAFIVGTTASIASLSTLRSKISSVPAAEFLFILLIEFAFAILRNLI